MSRVHEICWEIFVWFVFYQVLVIPFRDKTMSLVQQLYNCILTMLYSDAH